jgi:putative transport protein
MTEYVVDALRNHPELTIFLTLAVGFSIGKLRFGSFSLGTVVGTLLAGVVIGQLHIKVDPVVKNVCFDLFLFTIGYKVGPQFLSPESVRRCRLRPRPRSIGASC